MWQTSHPRPRLTLARVLQSQRHSKRDDPKTLVAVGCFGFAATVGFAVASVRHTKCVRLGLEIGRCLGASTDIAKNMEHPTTICCGGGQH